MVLGRCLSQLEVWISGASWEFYFMGQSSQPHQRFSHSTPPAQNLHKYCLARPNPQVYSCLSVQFHNPISWSCKPPGPRENELHFILYLWHKSFWVQSSLCLFQLHSARCTVGHMVRICWDSMAVFAMIPQAPVAASCNMISPMASCIISPHAS